MKFLRNPQVKQSVLTFLMITAAASAAALYFDIIFALFVMILCSILLLVHLLFTYHRYKKLESLSYDMDKILHGDDHTLWDLAGLRETYKGLLIGDNDFKYDEDELKHVKSKDILEQLSNTAMAIYNVKAETLGVERFREIERAVLLQNVDRNWMDHIDAMDDLKDSIRLQAYAQRDPVNEYRIQGADMFDAMVDDIRERTTRMILSITVSTPEVKRVQLANPITEGFEGNDGKKIKKVTVAKRSESVGRNDLCPCGSGKKYKKCCGAPGK